jgi:hypothetical protein
VKLKGSTGASTTADFTTFNFHAGPSRFGETKTDSFLLAGLPKTVLNWTGSWTTRVSMAKLKRVKRYQTDLTLILFINPSMATRI